MVTRNQTPARRMSLFRSARSANAIVTLLPSRHTVLKMGSSSTSFGYGPFRLFPM